MDDQAAATNEGGVNPKEDVATRLEGDASALSSDVLAKRARAAVFQIAIEIGEHPAKGDDKGEDVRTQSQVHVVTAAAETPRKLFKALQLHEEHLRAWLNHPATINQGKRLDLPASYIDLIVKAFTGRPDHLARKLETELRPAQVKDFLEMMQLVLGWAGEWTYECVMCDRTLKSQKVVSKVFALLTEEQTKYLHERNGPRGR